MDRLSGKDLQRSKSIETIHLFPLILIVGLSEIKSHFMVRCKCSQAMRRDLMDIIENRHAFQSLIIFMQW